METNDTEDIRDTTVKLSNKKIKLFDEINAIALNENIKDDERRQTVAKNILKLLQNSELKFKKESDEILSTNMESALKDVSPNDVSFIENAINEELDDCEKINIKLDNKTVYLKQDKNKKHRAIFNQINLKLCENIGKGNLTYEIESEIYKQISDFNVIERFFKGQPMTLIYKNPKIKEEGASVVYKC